MDWFLCDRDLHPERVKIPTIYFPFFVTNQFFGYFSYALNIFRLSLGFLGYV